MLTQQIRRQFLTFFQSKKHAIIPSSPVIPHNDPTLLFTNAGMNQFKELFLGESKRDYVRAATSQKCIRAGGKHNDLENVGHTARHLTFFEMLGNFSFGDYFKKEAISYAWEFATEHLGFEADKIWPTIFEEDEEAYELWKLIVPSKRIIRFGSQTNFWSMGDVGPCGPCSELLYDRGSSYSDAATPLEDKEEVRYLEFWNLVFMQYNKLPDGTLQPLPNPSIDTGAGLERLVALKMGVESVFETDLLGALIAQVEKICGKQYDPTQPTTASAFHVIADHMRSLSFAIADGAQPSNIERGYVLRKILRRALRYARQLGIERPFLSELYPTLLHSMGEEYRELIAAQSRVEEILFNEEEACLRTWRRGGNLMNQVIDEAKKEGGIIKGEEAFKLKDTYGLPLEEIMLIAKDNEIKVELQRFEELEQEQRERSRSSQRGVEQVYTTNLFERLAKDHTTVFCGYESLNCEGELLAIVVKDSLLQKVEEGQEAILLLSQTPFYAEMGGQTGDQGILSNGSTAKFIVKDTKTPYKGVIAHIGVMHKGSFSLHEKLQAQVDETRRRRIECNHTATHLLHWALQKVLGEHIRQAGSVVDDKRLRFDFSHHKALLPEQIREVEDVVNQQIYLNKRVSVYQLPYQDVQKRADIKQFFGDKYDSVVRVVDIDLSKELCGGTHAKSTSEIGLFRIVKEGSIAAGVRRIEALTGLEAVELARHDELLIDEVLKLLKTNKDSLIATASKLIEERSILQQQLKTLTASQRENLIKQLEQQIEMCSYVPLITAELSSDDMRPCADALMKRQPSLMIVFGSVTEQKCQLLVRLSDDLIQQGLNAKEIIKEVAPLIGGSGGGQANQAQAGGSLPEKLNEAFDKVRQLIKKIK